MFASFVRVIRISTAAGPSPILRRLLSDNAPQPLRSIKPKSTRKISQFFVDIRRVRALAGKGGDGNISYMQIFGNDKAGPDGGDGGNGGHVVFKADIDTRDLNHLSTQLIAKPGEDGGNKNCTGANARHLILPVPLGTIIRDSSGRIVGDLAKAGTMFVAARGGAGGRGNHFFLTDTRQRPMISEQGAQGEDIVYTLEVRSMAHIGLIGFPNAGKSTLLAAVTRARPKIASYPFTTLRPNLGMIHYDDYEQIAIADLPGLIPGSHKNRGLGIQFLKHAERCRALLFMIDLASDEPWEQFETLTFELSQFSAELARRPKLIVGNKIDLLEARQNEEEMRRRVDVPMIAISAKIGTNVEMLLHEIRKMYDTNRLMQSAGMGGQHPHQ